MDSESRAWIGLMGAGGGEARSKHRAPAARGKNRSSLLFPSIGSTTILWLVLFRTSGDNQNETNGVYMF
jgi:hypothetical protein